MGCCDTLIKYIVFLFNFVFFLTSVALIGIGAYVQINMTKVRKIYISWKNLRIVGGKYEYNIILENVTFI